MLNSDILFLIRPCRIRRGHVPIFAEKIENAKCDFDKGKCNVPACALFGSESALFRAGQEQTQEVYSNVTVATVEGSGHWTSSESPEDFVNKVIEYISHH